LEIAAPSNVPPPASYPNSPAGSPSPNALPNLQPPPRRVSLFHDNGPDLILMLPPRENTHPLPSHRRKQTYTRHRGRWRILKHLRQVRIVALPRAHIEVMGFPYESLLRGIRNPKAMKRVGGLEKEAFDAAEWCTGWR